MFLLGLEKLEHENERNYGNGYSLFIEKTVPIHSTTVRAA